MATEKTKRFFEFLKKLELIVNSLDRTCKEEAKQKFALCLTELRFRAERVVALIDDVANSNPQMSEAGADALMTSLVELQIELYDEVSDWLTDLKRPLQLVIDALPVEGDEES